MNLHDEAVIVAENMKQHGGHFVKYLSKAILAADNNNLEKIKSAWPEYWNEYLHWDD